MGAPSKADADVAADNNGEHWHLVRVAREIHVRATLVGPEAVARGTACLRTPVEIAVRSSNAVLRGGAGREQDGGEGSTAFLP